MLEWIQSERSSLIPKIDGQLLCSTIDPVIEGRRWAEKILSISKEWEAFFILGLGGGYHVSALASLLPDTEVTVIEHNRVLESELLSRRGPLPSNVTILAGLKPQEIRNQVFVRSGLRSLYGVGRHPSSVRLQKEYYREMEMILLGRTPSDIRLQSETRPGLSQLFQSLDLFQEKKYEKKEITVIDLVEALKRRATPLEKEAITFMVLRELVK
jgi:hypothetical protein